MSMCDIVMDTKRFKELILKEEKLRVMTEALYQDSELSWDETRLSFNTSSIENFLMVADSRRYLMRYKELKGEKNGTDKDSE